MATRTIDSHQHFWKFDADQYGWMKPEWPIRRDFMPSDLAPLLTQAGIRGSIAVQARQTVEESRWLLELADQSEMILGVVGWVDLRSDRVEEELARLAAHPKFVGVRHVVQDEPDDRFLVRPDFERGIAKLRAFDLTYDLLLLPRQLPAALELVSRHPLQPFVVDHISKPRIRDGVMEPWRGLMHELAQAPNVFCKVSGMVTEAKWNEWKATDFYAYLDVVFEAFGAQRLLFGSDWPVCLLAGADYNAVVQLISNYLKPLSASEKEAVMGGNAARFYGLQGISGPI